MTAAKVMDIISRLPGCAGQAADAVSVTQVKWRMLPKLLAPKSDCPDIWLRQPRHKWRKSWSSKEDPVVRLERNFVRSSLCREYYGKGNLRKSYCSTVGRRFPTGNAHSYTVKKGFSYLCMWMTKNWLKRTQILIRCGEYSTKEVDLGEPTSFLDHVYLVCTQRQCEINKDIVDNLLQRPSYFFAVLRYGGSCPEMCGTIL